MYDRDEQKYRKKDFVAGKVYIIDRQRRSSDFGHWTWNMHIPLEKISKFQWKVLTINAKTSKVSYEVTNEWNDFITKSNFIKIPNRYAIMAYFNDDNKSWISYVF
jgi:predicted metalloprotease with PDZ domain